MNGKKAKQLRAMAKELAVSKLRLLVPPSEQDKITVESLPELEARQDEYVTFSNGSVNHSVFSSKWFERKLKKFLKNRVILSPNNVNKLLTNAKA